MQPLRRSGNHFIKPPSEKELKTELDRFVTICKKALEEHKIRPKYEPTVKSGLEDLQKIQADPRDFFSAEEGRGTIQKMLQILEANLKSFMK
jgi:hypothetical protein